MPRQITKNLRLFKNSYKLDLSYNGLLYENEVYNILNEENNNNEYNNKEKLYNPFYNLIENFENIKIIMAQNDMNIMEYLYLNRKKINNILLEEDRYLFIDSNIIKNFSDYYYLYMLIKENSDLIFYQYNFALIRNCYDLLIFSKGTLKTIILAKITMVLTNNYYYDPPLSNENENQKIIEKDCDYIFNKCKEIIKNEKDELKKYIGNEELYDFEIDELYSSILVSLIKNNKLNDSYETKALLNEIEIKNIRLNKTIFDGLKKVLTEDYLSKYKISTYDDLFKEDKIIFYYILFVFILKSSDYVFHIPFLLETRRQIIKIINDNIGYFASDLKTENNKENINILKQVLEYFIDLKYYMNKAGKNQIKKPIKKQLKNSTPILEEELVDFYHPFPNYHEDFIRYIPQEPKIEESLESLPYKVITNSTFTISVEYKEGKKEAFFNYEKISVANEVNYEIEYVKSLKSENTELNIYYGKFINFLEMIESELKSNYKQKKKTDIDLKFKKYSPNNDYKINCYYTIKDDNIEDKDFIDENILNTEYERIEGLNYMLEVLKDY